MKKIRFIRAANNESDNIAGWLELADFSGTVTVVYNAGTTREQVEAKAHELVRRWDAFEEGGLVEELRKICEEFMERADDGSADFDDPAPDSIFIRAAAIIEAALAKS